jgi:Holliday junction resolvase RusA-like endonuclease
MTDIELPYPPSLNHYYRRVGHRTLISRDGRNFRWRVGAILQAQSIRSMAGPLWVTIAIHPPDNRRRDLDNIHKALLDALEYGGAYRDDSQIVRLVAEKCECVAGGRAIVRIERAETT